MEAVRIPLVEPKAEITRTLIHRLVHAFYDRVRQDEILGPIFESAVRDRWGEHLAGMVEFWSSIALRTGGYGGKPHMAHHGLNLTPDHFDRWLALFEEATREICGEASPFFIDRAHRIAASLQASLNIQSRALRLPTAPPEAGTVP